MVSTLLEEGISLQLSIIPRRAKADDSGIHASNVKRNCRFGWLLIAVDVFDLLGRFLQLL
jgi:hypothetical protein